jgi:hypothetical protein
MADRPVSKTNPLPTPVVSDGSSEQPRVEVLARDLAVPDLEVVAKRLLDFGMSRCKNSASEFRLKSRARRRAERWYKCRVAASGLKTAKSDHLAELSALAGSGARLVGPVTQHQGDELSAALHVDAPWFADVTTHIMVQLRRQISEGKVGMRLHPILLVGPFGNGKSKYARNLAALVNAPSHEIDVGSGSAGFRISGVERGWGSATPGVPVETIFKSGVANPFMIVNEIEKAGEMRSERVGGTTSIAVSLLQMLEPGTAAVFDCPYYRVRFNMSHLNWILTANTLETVPPPLLDRCHIFHVPRPAPEHLFALYDRMVGDLDTHLQSYGRDTLAKALRSPENFSLRLLNRMVDILRAESCRPVLN